MKALITIELDYPNQIYDLYEANELRLYFSKEGFYIWEGGFEIKPVPEKLEYKGIEDDNIEISKAIAKSSWYRFAKPNEAIEFRSFAEGYNNCIDEILEGAKG